MRTRTKKKRPSLGRRIVEGLQEIASHARGETTGVVEFSVNPGESPASVAAKIRAATTRNARKTKIEKPPEIPSATTKKIRSSLGVSQQLFADFLGVGVGVVRAWEGGVKFPEGAYRRLLDDMDRSPDHWRARVNQSFAK